MLVLDLFENVLDKPELTPEQLAKKHGVSVDEINQQLDKGIKSELEHTSHKRVAREIALDHLAERPDYYTRLDRAGLEENQGTAPTLIDALGDFLPIAIKYLKLDHVPKIKLVKELHDTHVPTFGRFENESRVVSVVINNRNPVDIIRTLAHELAHYAQGERDELDADSWHTGSAAENQAHEQAGIMMREFDKQFSEYLTADPVMLPEAWSKGYKKSIDCSNPKGFSQKAHCAGRRARQAGKKTKSSSVSEEKDKCSPATQDIGLNLKNRQKAIDEYGYGPLNPLEPNVKFWKNKADMWQLDSIDEAKKSLCGNCAAFDISKDSIACIEKGIGTDSGSENPHDVVEAGDLGYCRFLKFKCASLRTCDAWVVGGPITENFADGKNPGRKGLAKRSGVDCKQSVTKLRDIAKHSSGERQRMAHWCANMKAGKK